MSGVVPLVVETTQPLHVREIPPLGGEFGPEESTSRGFGPDGEVFLLVHGYAASSYTWRHWTTPLARRGRVLTVDLKGFGEAPKPDDGRYGIPDLADLLVALVRELDLRGLTLVGHSLGGGLALLTALRLLDASEPRLSRLALVSAPAYEQRLPPFVTLSQSPRLTGALARLIGPERVVSQVLRTIVYDPDAITDEQIAAYARGLGSREAVRAAMEVGRSIVPEDLDMISRRYREIDVPTFLLWGEHDPVVPLWVGRRLDDELPDARLVVLDACGHLPQEERPDVSLAAFEAFLDETAVGGRPEEDGGADDGGESQPGG